MNGKERIANILQRKSVDRIGLYEHFWNNADTKWRAQGHIQEGESIADHFGFDLATCWCFNLVADLDFTPVVIEEDAENVLTKDGNGATLRRRKNEAGTPEHVDFSVRDRETWDALVRPKLAAFDPRRINVEQYRKARAAAAAAGRYFMWSGVNVFECMHPVCGHENMLVGMALEPEWVADMATVYSDLLLKCFATLFEAEGYPDGIWFYEDMGFKERPFMSPDMYRELIQPAHSRTIAWAHDRNMPVIMHSCGFVEPLLDGMVEAGIDCLQVMEVKAGMDPLRIHAKYGDRLSLCGGMDVRPLVANDRAAVLKEVRTKVPVLKQNNGYILHSDHSIPGDCDYETYKLFVEEGLRLGTY
jgi:uroporphyrinogen decarboxylase